MNRAVLDANVIVSAMISPGGVPGQILAAALSSRFLHVSSTAILDEVAAVLRRDRIRQTFRITQDEIDRVLFFLAHETTHAEITRQVHGVASHPEDDLVLATAVSGNVDHRVTGDRRLQELGRYEQVAIVSPRQFLDILQADDAEGGSTTI